MTAVVRGLNAVPAWLLRSSFSGLLERSTLLLEVSGRRTGRRYRVPVSYARRGQEIWVLVGRPEGRTWWRNLVREVPVRVWLDGRPVVATARVVRGADEPVLAGQGLRGYLDRFPAMARRSGLTGADGSVELAGLAELACRSVLVRVRLPAADAAGTTPAAPGGLPHPPGAGPGGPGRRGGAAGGGLRGLVRRHPLGSYFTLAYLLAWGYWIPDALTGGHLSHVPGLLAPAAAAVTVTGLRGGRAGLRDLAARAVRWRVAPRWYLVAAAPAAVAILTTAVLAAAGVDTPGWSAFGRMAGFPDLGFVGVLAGILLVNAFGEETGWRGFALPQLRRWHRPLQASVLVGLWWALWHLPTFFLDTGYRGTLHPLLLPGFVLGILAGSIVLTWVYEGSGASLLLAVLWHTSYNLGAATEAAQGPVAVVVTLSVLLTAVPVARRWASGRDAP